MNFNRFLIIISLIVVFIGCNKNFDKQTETQKINQFMDNWHLAAANADTSFFDYLDDDAIYIGTDASERWTKQEFKAFALPYFQKGKAWDFKTIERKVYFSNNGELAWFDETLDTWMGVCRSSGVLQNYDETCWKLKHYHLSIAVPNELVEEYLRILKEFSDVR